MDILRKMKYLTSVMYQINRYTTRYLKNVTKNSTTEQFSI